jgi:hypothetical protein
MLKTITSFVDSLGSLTYKGLWNAATNTPTLASGVGTTGDYYVVSVPGTTTLDGISSWAAGDWAIFNGSVWEKYNNPDDTLSEILANGNTTAGTDISVTTGDDITFADNSKAIFGASDDLSIYHDSSTNSSYIKEIGTGSFNIEATNLFLKREGGTESFIDCITNGAVTLYHDGSTTLATTATGIDVAGTVTADGLTVSGSVAAGAVAATILNSGANGAAQLYLNNDAQNWIVNTRVDDAFSIYNATSNKTPFLIATNGDISFYNDAAAQGLFWDSSESRLGLGTTTPSSYVSSASNLVIAGSAGSGMTIASGAGSAGNLFFADGTVTDSAYRGYVQYNHSTDALILGTSATERLRIDSLGNLLVSDTTANPSGDNVDSGIALNNAGLVRASTNNAAAPLDLNVKGRDGIIANFRRDGTSVGSIASKDGDMTIGTGDTGIRFYDGGNGIYPVNASTQAGLDATIDLGRVDGSGTFRFKDAYLSGGVYLGGTGAANLLDDYEEGTCFLTLTGATTAPTVAQTAIATYTKVGNTVTVVVTFGDKDVTGVAGNVKVTGFPFTTIGGAQLGHFSNSRGSTDQYAGYMPSSGTDMFQIDYSGNLLAWASTGTGTFAFITITYLTT